MECVFCDPLVLKKETFYGDGYFSALYNIRPAVKGHCLIVPARHIESLLEMNEEERKGLVSFLNRAVFLALRYSGANDFDILLQKGENAGQSIKHLHFHVLPRKRNDSLAVSKKEFMHSFAEKEESVKPLTPEEIDGIVGELRGIAEKHRLQINEM